MERRGAPSMAAGGYPRILIRRRPGPPRLRRIRSPIEEVSPVKSLRAACAVLLLCAPALTQDQPKKNPDPPAPAPAPAPTPPATDPKAPAPAPAKKERKVDA